MFLKHRFSHCFHFFFSMFFQGSTIVNDYFQCVFLDATIGNNFFLTISNHCNSWCKRWSPTILCPVLDTYMPILLFWMKVLDIILSLIDNKESKHTIMMFTKLETTMTMHIIIFIVSVPRINEKFYFYIWSYDHMWKFYLPKFKIFPLLEKLFTM